MRTTILAVALLLGNLSAAAALETPLVLRAPAGGNSELAIVLNPGLGTIQLYRIGGQSMILQSSYNFLADIERLSQVSVPGKEGEEAWPMLRTGTATSVPSYGDMFNTVLASPDRGRRQEGPTLQQRANASEEEYWAQGAPAYDGVVRAAMGPHALVLVLPGSYSILVYQVQNWQVQLAAARNYRPDLYIPQVVRSTPLPQEILQQLGDEIQAERREALQKQMEELGEGAGATIPLAESEAWIGVVSAAPERFLLVDPANKRIVLYQFQSRGREGQIQMLDVRNIEIDLLIPTVYQSTPTFATAVIDYNRRLSRTMLPNRQPIEPVSSAYLRRLTSTRAVQGEGISPVQMTLDHQGQLLIDFSQQSKMFVYRMRENIELLAARDYSIEVGMAMHAREIELRREAHSLMGRIEGLARRNGALAIEIARRALNWDPRLGADMERGRVGNAMARNPEITGQWQALLEEAAARAAQLAQEEEEIRREIAEEAAARSQRR